MTAIIDPVILVLMDFYADCYGQHDKTELIDYRKWAEKIDACHPKQSTELEEIMREFDENIGCESDEYFGKYWRESLRGDIRAFLTKAYHSGHTAGQAAGYKEGYQAGQIAEGKLWREAILSSLNKD